MGRSSCLLVITLLGPPGAGKRTQAKLLEDRFSLVHLSRVDIVREAIARRTESGVAAQGMMQAGDPVSDAIVLDILAQRMSEPDCAAGVILDDIPGSADQAAALDDRLCRDGLRVSTAICLELPDDVIVGRISGRHTCEKCGAGYHDTARPPTIGGVCDQCRHRKFRRWADDRPDAVRRRLAQYHAAAAPLIGHYRRRDLLTRIDASGPVNAVTARLRDLVRPVVTEIWSTQDGTGPGTAPGRQGADASGLVQSGAVMER